MKQNPYVTQQNELGIAWKNTTSTLPDEARAAGVYIRDGHPTGPFPICLPPEFARYNLLPHIREGALELFAELGIPWHDGIEAGPINHLRDSQVQCVNALLPMVKASSRIIAAFGDVVDIAELLEIEPGRYLTFEYIGANDYFGEGNGKPRVRGARCPAWTPRSATARPPRPSKSR